MTVWRMSFREGNEGAEMWPECYDRGVAAISYWPMDGVDLRDYPEGEPREYWCKLEQGQNGSLRKVVYKMNPGDTIYVKQGRQIVGRGTVTSRYFFDEDCDMLAEGSGLPWAHQVRIDWEPDFTPVTILLGSEPTTVLRLSGKRLQQLDKALGKAKRDADKIEVKEGKRYRAEATFRTRSRALIRAKKESSDGSCEVCGFRFDTAYRKLSRDCLIAHHLKQIGGRLRASTTTIDDIALLCPNCHAAVHTEDPPIPPDKLRRMLKG